MKKILALAFFALCFTAIRVSGQGDTPPPWAYPQAQSQQRPPDDGKVHHLEGSTGAFTATQINDPFAPPDWYPNEHPPMPEVVAHGRKPDLRACGQCHLPHALTRPAYSRLTTMRHTTSPRRKPLILVVEDHDSARTALTKLLSSTGYDVVEAPNGSEALAQLATGPRPDLILLDLMMPVMDGWEFLRRQRFDWHLCTIPTIVVSGVASHDPRCLEMPIVRLLPKPYTVDQLVAAIDAEISTRQAPDPPIMLGVVRMCRHGVASFATASGLICPSSVRPRISASSARLTCA